MLVMLVRHLTTWSVLSVADIPLGPGLGPINPVAPLGLSTMASFEPELYHQLLEARGTINVMSIPAINLGRAEWREIWAESGRVWSRQRLEESVTREKGVRWWWRW